MTAQHVMEAARRRQASAPPITYSTFEAAWMLDVSKKTVMRRCRHLGVGIQQGSGYWRFSPEEVTAMRSVGRMAGKS